MGRAGSAAALAIALSSALACSPAATLRGRIAGLEGRVAEAEANGAMRCAPRELAIAKAHLRFAKTDLDQGVVSDADRHVAIAEPNARAALSLSPEGRCKEDAPHAGDRDGDGIPDTADRCPDARENYDGFEDADGCPDDRDTDGDGVPDSRDACTLVAEDKDGYLDDDGCPDVDDDADGVPDPQDKCPKEPEDPDGFEDEDGCPEPDNDKDTVKDLEDQCPNTPGQTGGDRPGCPGLVVVTAKEIRITQQIQFEHDKSAVKPVSFPILDAVYDVLWKNPAIRLEVQGHTDNVGQAAHNKKLSQQRADSVKAYLLRRGIEGSRLVAKGYGPSQPLVPNTNDGNRALNRRVQFLRTEEGRAP
jgi:outer membrane protein OmpA-like peptidoglycan-associated protein